MSLKLESAAFGNGQAIPVRYTCDGDNVSPPLAWSGIPGGAESLTLLCDDPDAPAGTWTHWAAFDIPPSTDALPEAFPADAEHAGVKQGKNDFGRIGYGGPCPPPGHGVHHYRFRLLALDVGSLGLAAGADFHDVEKKARDHVLATAELIGTYER